MAENRKSLLIIATGVAAALVVSLVVFRASKNSAFPPTQPSDAQALAQSEIKTSAAVAPSRHNSERPNSTAQSVNIETAPPLPTPRTAKELIEPSNSVARNYD